DAIASESADRHAEAAIGTARPRASTRDSQRSWRIELPPIDFVAPSSRLFHGSDVDRRAGDRGAAPVDDPAVHLEALEEDELRRLLPVLDVRPATVVRPRAEREAAMTWHAEGGDSLAVGASLDAPDDFFACGLVVLQRCDDERVRDGSRVLVESSNLEAIILGLFDARTVDGVVQEIG